MLLASTLLLAVQSPLAHSAPWLGHPLDVDLTGLIPGAAVALYYSPSAASIPKSPHGTSSRRLSGWPTYPTSPSRSSWVPE